MLALADALDLYRAVGLVLIQEQLLAVILGLGLATVFLVKPMKAGVPRSSVPWHDLLAALLAFGSCSYVAFNYYTIVDTLFEKPATSVFASIVIVMSVAECLRRTAGPFLFGFVLFFLALGLVGHLLPGPFQGRDVDLDRLLIYVGLDSNGIIGLPLSVVVSIVIAFIFLGNLLNASGGANFFTELSTAVTGRYRGGSAKTAVVASSLFGSISGSAVSNVVSTGVITIPLMKKSGYPADRASAIEAVASTGGQLMPPMLGAAAFLMAEFLQIPVTEVMKAAFIPAILYYFALFIQVDLYAAREHVAPIGETQSGALEILANGWMYLSPFVVILIGLFFFNLRPQAAAMWATAVILPLALLFGYRGARMHWSDIFTALGDTGVAVTQLLMVSAMAGVVVGVLNITGLGFALTQAVIELSGGHLSIVLLLAAAISILLGMGMPTVGVYLLLATLVAPSMVDAGVPPIAAHMFAFYFGILSMITPPVAAATFAAATVGKADFIRTGLVAMAFGWPAYVVPFIFAASPEMLWQGSAFEILRVATLSLAGVWLISSGWIGYSAGSMSRLWRIGFIIAGTVCLLPGNAIEFGALLDIVGVLGGATMVAIRFWTSRKREKKYE